MVLLRLCKNWGRLMSSRAAATDMGPGNDSQGWAVLPSPTDRVTGEVTKLPCVSRSATTQWREGSREGGRRDCPPPLPPPPQAFWQLGGTGKNRCGACPAVHPRTASEWLHGCPGDWGHPVICLGPGCTYLSKACHPSWKSLLLTNLTFNF